MLPECLLNPGRRHARNKARPWLGATSKRRSAWSTCCFGALGLAAASQGTMNNALFGDGTFGYYETICGGAGATPNADGADAVHTHMTNTRLTDPEVLEQRYPVRLREFSIRRGSGGAGRASRRRWHRAADRILAPARGVASCPTARGRSLPTAGWRAPVRLGSNNSSTAMAVAKIRRACPIHGQGRRRARGRNAGGGGGGWATASLCRNRSAATHHDCGKKSFTTAANSSGVATCETRVRNSRAPGRPCA